MTDNFQSSKVVSQEQSSSTKFDNFVQAVEDAINSLDNTNVSASAAIAQSKLAFDAYSTYVPTWTATGTAPSLGNGTLAGRYMQIGKLVFVTIEFTAGSSTTFGTGGWRFTAPVTPRTSSKAIGEIRAIDTGVSEYPGFVVMEATLLRLMFSTAVPEATVSAPFAWANTDQFHLSATYEAA